MFSKIKNTLKSSLFSIIGFGVSFAILGYIHTTDNRWVWLLGFTAMGIIGGVTLGFILGDRNTAQKLAVFGAIAGALGAFLTIDSDYSIWLQITIIGIVVGIVLGIAFSILATRDKISSGKAMYCSECNSKVYEKDKYCSQCGAKFE